MRVYASNLSTGRVFIVQLKRALVPLHPDRENEKNKRLATAMSIIGTTVVSVYSQRMISITHEVRSHGALQYEQLENKFRTWEIWWKRQNFNRTLLTVNVGDVMKIFSLTNYDTCQV